MAQNREPSTDTPDKDDTGHGDRMIANTLKRFYDGVVDEGTPDALLDLLERLDEAERRTAPKSS